MWTLSDGSVYRTYLVITTEPITVFCTLVFCSPPCPFHHVAQVTLHVVRRPDRHHVRGRSARQRPVRPLRNCSARSAA